MVKHILAFCLLLNFALAYGQNDLLNHKVTLHVKNATLDSVLEMITQQTGVNFSYSNQSIQSERTISIIAEDKPLTEVLNEISEKLHLQFKEVKDQVVIKAAKEKPAEEEKFTISGHVRDAETGESLPGATIWDPTSQSGTISNNYGFYSLTLPRGSYGLQYSYVGFEQQLLQIDLQENMRKDVGMALNAALLGEVTITTDEKLETIEKSQMSKIRVNPATLNTLPEFAGEVGLIKSLQTFPGIKTHSDGSAFFFVRGGNKDQNLILIDEAPVYNPAHLFGYYSVIIPDVAKEINIYKADMPIEKGDRLSSVIDVQTKDGNLHNFGMTGVLNPLIHRFAIEAPIVKEKSSVFASYRHSNFRWLYRLANADAALYLFDLNFKLNWKLSKNDRLYYSFFYGKDNFTNQRINETGGIRWYNFTSTLRWNHIYNSRLFSNLTLYTSTYNYNLLADATIWESEINNVTINYDFSYFINPETSLRFGINQTFHDFNPGNLTADENNPYIPKVSGSKAAKTVFYVNREHNINENWSWKIGARMPIWTMQGPAVIYQFDSSYNVTDTLTFQEKDAIKTFVNLDPRLSLKYRISKNASFKLSWGIYHQYLNLISNSISPFTSFEIWMPSGTNIKPQRANQFAIGINKFLEKQKVEFVAEAYYKKMFNQVDYEPHANILLNPLFEGELRFGTARAYGLELSLRRTEGRLTGWISYTYSRVFKKIDGLNEGNEFPAYYDRPNDFSIFLSYHLSKRVNISANWTYYTGSAITTPIGFYSYNGSTIPLYGEKNNDRLPDYHRLDVALAWMLNKPGNNFQHSLSFAIYNFYNRHNPVSVNFNKVETKEGKFVVPANLYGTQDVMVTQKYLLGIMPSITYKFKI